MKLNFTHPCSCSTPAAPPLPPPPTRSELGPQYEQRLRLSSHLVSRSACPVLPCLVLSCSLSCPMLSFQFLSCPVLSWSSPVLRSLTYGVPGNSTSPTVGSTRWPGHPTSYHPPWPGGLHQHPGALPHPGQLLRPPAPAALQGHVLVGSSPSCHPRSPGWLPTPPLLLTPLPLSLLPPQAGPPLLQGVCSHCRHLLLICPGNL